MLQIPVCYGFMKSWEVWFFWREPHPVFISSNFLCDIENTPGPSDPLLPGKLSPHSDLPLCCLLPLIFWGGWGPVEWWTTQGFLTKCLLFPEKCVHLHSYMGFFVITQPGFPGPEVSVTGTWPKWMNQCSSPWVVLELGKSDEKQWNIAQNLRTAILLAIWWKTGCNEREKSHTQREAESKDTGRVQSSQSLTF